MFSLHTLLIALLLVTYWAGYPARVVAATNPPDWLTPRPVESCTMIGGAPDPCADGEITDIDAAVDGQTVSFVSSSNRLVPNDRNRAHDVFVWRGGEVQRVSVDAGGTEGTNHSDRAAISGNGRYVYFRSFAGNFVTGTMDGRANLYLKDLMTGQLALISRDAEGAPANPTGLVDHFDQIDTDYSGRYVVFASAFSSFVVGADSNFVEDVFLADVDPDGNGNFFDVAPVIYVLSAKEDGITTGNGASFAPSIAQQAGAVVWLTRATDLTSGLDDNGNVSDVVMVRFGVQPDGSVNPAVRTLTAINRMGDVGAPLTPQGARLARIDPWRDQVAFVTADAIPGTGDDHVGEDVYLSIGHGSGDERSLIWASDGYAISAPSVLALAWDPQVPAAATSQVAWVAQDTPRLVDDLLLCRTAPLFPAGWSTVNWVDAATPSSAPVLATTLSADGRYAFWTTTESYDLDVPPASVNLFRRAIAPSQSVPLTVQGVGGGAFYAPEGVLIDGTMHFSPTLVVTLTPHADVGYRFREWSGVDASMGMTATVLVYGARTVSVTFDAMTRPVAADVTVTTMEDSPVEEITLAISDPDPDEAHTVTLAEPPSHGTASVLNNVAHYQPAPNFNGQDEFTLQVTDAYGLMLATPAQVKITVTPVNDAPAAASAQSSGENTGAAILVPVTVVDADVEDSYTLAVETPPEFGSVRVGEQLQTVGNFEYTPAEDFAGVDSFTFRVTDSGNASITGTATVTVTAPLTVPPTIDALHLPALRRAP